MKLKETLEAMLDHLGSDTHYQMFKSYDKNGNLILSNNEAFDVTNEIPKNHHAPYFKIDNLDQAKWLLKNIYSNISENEVEEKLNLLLSEKPIDISKDLYISAFHPDRI